MWKLLTFYFIICSEGGISSTAIPYCSTEERLDMLEQYCEANNVAENYMKKNVPLYSNTGGSRTSDDYLDMIPDRLLMKLAHELWLDPVNEVIVCMHAKAGCSTWKTILGNNTRSSPLPPDYGRRNHGQGIHNEVFRMGMKCADEGGNPQIIRQRLKNWYKFAIVRHPFDR